MDARPTAQDHQGGGAPFTPRQLRALKIAVVVMGIILIVGFAAVIGRIAYLVMRGNTFQPAAARPLVQSAHLPLPPGATVRSMSLAGDRLAVHYDSPGGPAIVILDLVTGSTLSRIDLSPR